MYVDVQSDFVRLSTRLCIPLFRHVPPLPVIQGAQALIDVGPIAYVMDVPNLLAVPAAMLRQRVGHLPSADQMRAESCIEFMFRGY